MIVPATPIARVGWRSGSAARTASAIARSVLAELLGQPDGADVHAHGAVGEHELGRAAADVHDHYSVEVVAAESRAGEGEPRFLLAREQPRREAVAPFDLAEEGLAVLGVADGARRDAKDALGAELLDPPAVLGEDVAHARDGEGEEPPACVHALAEASDLLAPLDRLDPAVADVGDEKPRRVRAEIDGRNTHGAIIAAATRGGAVR